MSSALLRLQEITALDLRCHHRIRWQCSPGLNMIIGENGSGKTSLLEAVFLMGHGRSFRQSRAPVLSRWKSHGFSVSGKWMRYGPLYVEVSGKGNGNQVCLQGRRLQQRTELTETLPVLAESPQGARLVDGVPGERRRWLDQMMLYCKPDVVRHYHAYLRCLMQRGRLLRRGGAVDEIEAWEHQMTVHGSVLVNVRDSLMNDLNSLLESDRKLSEADVRLSIQPTAPTDREAWADKLAIQRKKGQSRGVLRIGPHCDRIVINYGGRDIRACGSRGQQKLVAIAIRLAECTLRMQHRGLMPVLLLDDCLEALDPLRQQQLLTRLGEHAGQVLMTGPSGTYLPGGLEVAIHTFETPVQDGRKEVRGEKRPVMTGVEEAA